MAVLEAVAAEVALTAALGRAVDRIGMSRLTRRGRARDEAEQAMAVLRKQDFAGRLNYAVLVEHMPDGVNLAKVLDCLRSPAVNGSLDEIIAVLLTGGSAGQVRSCRQAFLHHGSVDLKRRLPDATTTAISVALEQTFNELSNVVQAMLTTLETHDVDEWRALRELASLSLLQKTADAIHRRSPTFVDPIVLLTWKQRYLPQVRDAHGHIHPPDFERRRKVPIDKLYVSPTLAAGSVSVHQHLDPLSLSHVMSAIDRTVILGDPGGGKSTAASYMAWSLAREAQESEGRVPIFVTLRDYAPNMDTTSIVAHIEERLSAYYQCPAPSGAIEELLQSGEAFVILDGLDELIDTHRRRELTQRVELFSSAFPLARMVVTSRQVGYDEARLDASIFSTFTLSSFRNEDVQDYVTKWFSCVEDLTQSEADTRASAFEVESRAASDLRCNPLILSLMCIIYRGQNWIPRNRPALYEHCANLLFDKWDSSRQIHVELRAGAHVDTAVKHLALWMFEHEESAEGVTESALVAETTKVLKDAFDSETEAHRAALEFVAFCRGRAWVLIDAGTTADGESLFKFTHRTFMEYFAAYQLTRITDGPERLAQRLLPHIARAEWQIVAELALQISDRHTLDGAARISSRLMSDKRHTSAESRHNIFLFLARCLSFTRPSPAIARSITEGALDSTISILEREEATPGIQRERNAYAVSNLSGAAPDTLSFVEEALESALDERLRAKRSGATAAHELTLELSTVMRHMGGTPVGRSSSDDETNWLDMSGRLLRRHPRILNEASTVSAWSGALSRGLISIEAYTAARRSPAGPMNAIYATESLKYFNWTYIPWAWWLALGAPAGSIKEQGAARKHTYGWLAEQLISLKGPWASDVSTLGVFVSGSSEDGATLLGADETEAWARMLLVLPYVESDAVQVLPSVSMTAAAERSADPTRGTAGDFVTALTKARTTGDMPRWFAEHLATLPSSRQSLMRSWCASEWSTLSTNV